MLQIFIDQLKSVSANIIKYRYFCLVCYHIAIFIIIELFFILLHSSRKRSVFLETKVKDLEKKDKYLGTTNK